MCLQRQSIDPAAAYMHADIVQNLGPQQHVSVPVEDLAPVEAKGAEGWLKSLKHFCQLLSAISPVHVPHACAQVTTNAEHVLICVYFAPILRSLFFLPQTVDKEFTAEYCKL